MSIYSQMEERLEEEIANLKTENSLLKEALSCLAFKADHQYKGRDRWFTQFDKHEEVSEVIGNLLD